MDKFTPTFYTSRTQDSVGYASWYGIRQYTEVREVQDVRVKKYKWQYIGKSYPCNPRNPLFWGCSVNE